ncbi:C40 family peptidase [Gephyromycinifex aptenodytis]|uniref:C40 family peptidase n=1 Tax=Gephyromycinifex aptenodytis TaxID=2716227 RepID=UPI001D024C61|nr:C40 family peptidase [Gephyromycinifex aptenodytis]
MSTRYAGRHRAAQTGSRRQFSRGVGPASVASIMLASSALIASLAVPAAADPDPSDRVVAAQPAYEDPSEQGDYTSPRPEAQLEAAPQEAPTQAEPAPQVSPSPAPTQVPAQKKPAPAASAPARKKVTAKAATPAQGNANGEMGAGVGVVSIASSLSGISYRWGGTTPRGFDCSGYTRYVYRKAGVSLPRTAAQQQRATKRVSKPRPGDLVFFGRPAHHVGIYAGNGKMYDAPRRGRSTGLHKIWSSKVSYGRVR